MRAMLQSVLFRITCTRTFVLRAGRVEVIADSESQTAVVCSLIQVELMDIAEDGDLLAHGGKDIVNGQLHTQAVMEECLVKTQVKLPRLGHVYVLRIPGRAP